MAKKKIKKKIAKKKTVKKAAKKSPKPIGRVTHFYNRIGVGIVKFHKIVPVGTMVAFRGATTDFKITIASMQYDHAPISKAPKGKEVGIKVKKPVREGDAVYFVEE